MLRGEPHTWIDEADKLVFQARVALRNAVYTELGVKEEWARFFLIMGKRPDDFWPLAELKDQTLSSHVVIKRAALAAYRAQDTFCLRRSTTRRPSSS